MTNEVVLLASGGLDSTTLAYVLENDGFNVVPLFVNYGQHCADTEFATLQAVMPPRATSRIVTTSVNGLYSTSSSRLIAEADLWKDKISKDDLYLPYRNVLLLTIAAAYAATCNIGAVYAAFINTNHAIEIDCSAGFFNQLGSLLSDFGGVKLVIPFRNMSKGDVAKLGLSLGAPIAHTYSCQTQSVIPCGACANCVERLDALDGLNQ